MRIYQEKGVFLALSPDGKCRDILRNSVFILNTRRWIKPGKKVYVQYVIGVVEEEEDIH
jgi:hypothetical protein